MPSNSTALPVGETLVSGTAPARPEVAPLSVATPSSSRGDSDQLHSKYLTLGRCGQSTSIRFERVSKAYVRHRRRLDRAADELFRQDRAQGRIDDSKPPWRRACPGLARRCARARVRSTDLPLDCHRHPQRQSPALASAAIRLAAAAPPRGPSRPMCAREYLLVTLARHSIPIGERLSSGSVQAIFVAHVAANQRLLPVQRSPAAQPRKKCSAFSAGSLVWRLKLTEAV